MQSHTVLLTKTFINRWQYLVIEYWREVMQDLVASQNSKIFFPTKRKTKLGTFNIILKLNSLVLLKLMKSCIPFTFISLTYDYKSCLVLLRIKWLLTTIFINPSKNICLSSTCLLLLYKWNYFYEII